MNSIIEDNEKKIRSIVLTKEQEEEAYFEGQKKRFFKEKFKTYWDQWTAPAVEATK